MKKVVLLALTALFISFASCRDKKEDVSASEALIEEMQEDGADIKVKQDGDETKIKMETDEKSVKIKTEDGATKIKVETNDDN